MSCPDTVRKASRPKKSCAKSTLPSGVRGRFIRSSVDTRNSSPAPSASDGGDDGRVDPEEAVLVEKAVDRLGDGVAHARDRADDVGARPQMRHFAQVFHAVRLGLDRIGVRIFDPADHLDLARLHFERLALGRRGHDAAGRFDRAAGGQMHDLVGVIGQRVRRHHLHRMKARAVGNVHEGNAGFRIAAGAHPALERDRGIRGRAAGEDVEASAECHDGSRRLKKRVDSQAGICGIRAADGGTDAWRTARRPPRSPGR